VSDQLYALFLFGLLKPLARPARLLATSVEPTSTVMCRTQRANVVLSTPPGPLVQHTHAQQSVR